LVPLELATPLVMSFALRELANLPAVQSCMTPTSRDEM